MGPFISIQTAALGRVDSATESSSRGLGGLAVCDADSLREEDHQQCGANTHVHTHTVCWLSVYQAEPGVVEGVMYQPVSIVPCRRDGRRFRILLSGLQRCQSASIGINKLMRKFL